MADSNDFDIEIPENPVEPQVQKVSPPKNPAPLSNAVELPDIEFGSDKKSENYLVEPDAKAVAVKFGIIGAGQGGCVAGRTNVYLSNYGILPIKELFEEALAKADVNDIHVAGNGDVGVALNGVYTSTLDATTGDLVRVPVKMVWKNKVNSHKKVTLSNKTELHCSVTHPTFVLRGSPPNLCYKSLNDSQPIEKGDRVFDGRGTVLDASGGSDVIHKGVTITEDLGWVLGLFTGCGKFDGEVNRVSFFLDDERVVSRAKTILSTTFPHNTTSVSQQQDFQRLTIDGIQASAFFKSAFNFNGGSKHSTLGVPRCVSASSSKTRMAFLAGVIDSDAGVSDNWCETEITTVSEQFSDELACLGSSLGMRPTVSINQISPPNEKRWSTSTQKTCYKITVSGKANHGPLMGSLVEQVTHSLRKTRLSEYVEDTQKSGIATVPISYQEIKGLLAEGGFVDGDQADATHGLHLNEWIREEKNLSLSTFGRLLTAFDNSSNRFITKVYSGLNEIEDIQDDDHEGVFYDLTVESTENYFAGNRGMVLTHNSRIADTFYQIGYRRVCVVNTTTQDFLGLELPTKNQKVFESSAGGAGKDPSKGYEAIRNSSEEVMNLMRHSFGEDIEHIIVCVGSGGGSGTGCTIPLINMAKYYLRNLGKPEKVGVVASLPKFNEGGKVQENAYNLMLQLEKLLEQKTISPLVITDNQMIHQMFPNVPAKKFWSTANKNTVGLFDIFNVLACQRSAYVTFDRADYRSILSSGLIIFGATKLDRFEKDTDIADCLRTNLKRTLLAEADLFEASHAAALIAAPDNILSILPQTYLDLAFNTMERILGSENKNLIFHQGVYEATRVGLYVYSMVGGLKIPVRRMNQMRAKAGVEQL